MNAAMSTPDGFVKEVWKKIPDTVKAAFFGAVVIGLMTHLYEFTNKLYNYDELMNTPNGYGTGAESGRWFLRILGDIFGAQFGNYSLPFVNGMLSVFLLAVSAALIANMFQMHSKLLAVALGGFFISFPAVTSTFLFMYTAVFYSVAVFFSVLAAWLVIRFPKNIVLNVLSIVLIACSLGIYQAYFSNTACLFVMSIIFICAFSKEEKTWKEVFFLALRYVLILAVGMVLYFILHKFLVAHWGLEVNSYQGLDSMGQTSVAEVFSAIKGAYLDFINLFRSDVMCLNPTTYVRKCYFLMMASWGIGALCLLFGEKGCKVKKVFMILGFMVFPIAVYLIYIMTPNGWVYTLMAYSVVFVSIFTLIWADQFHVSFDKKEIVRKGTQWIAALTSLVMILVYIWYGNGCYMSLEYTKYHDMSYFQTMVTQIKSLEGYNDELPLALVGNEINDATNNMGSLVGGTFGLGGKSETNISAYSRNQIITKYLGFAPRFCSYEEIVALMENEEVQAMPSYPDDGSVKIVDGVIVVKIME
ncbi:MAG: glucosyltransferase domain-containing protein [Clostridiales bacterium]|nr:glucosyltransferase domain-containing protein [Clostridiales bacterium]